MADYRQAGAGGILFMGLLQAQGQEMTHEMRRILYRSMYSNIVAKIDNDPKFRKDEELKEIISKTSELLIKAGEDYDPTFELLETYSQTENNFAELLAQILDHIWVLAIKAKLIESITVEQEVVG